MEKTYGLDEITRTAEWLLGSLEGRKVVALHGNLGAGKTTFVRALCQALQVTTPVSSPTFSIINEYRAGRQRIFHIDLYRLRDEQEALQAGVEDCLYSGDLCFVEWPEKAPSIFPEETLHLFFETVDQLHRKIVISDN